jgi:cysteine desulfurase/selenocysteine lyase
MALIRSLLTERFGAAPLPRVVLLNKGSGLDRRDLVIAHGAKYGWLSFDPVTRTYDFDITAEALPYLITGATMGIVDIPVTGDRRRIGGKKLPVSRNVPEGTMVVRYGDLYGTGSVRDGSVRVREVLSVHPAPQKKDPDWDLVVTQNRFHLRNLERHAIREIRRYSAGHPCVNVSFSGGKDSTAVLELARRAGITDAFFIDTGIEFPETMEYVRGFPVAIVPRGGDFWAAVEKAGPPAKDHRWCCKLLKLNPLKRHLATTGPCTTVQGNRWYESWNRADLGATSQNPDNPLQLNLSPIRNWRALEVFLYLWFRGIAHNPLYEKGIERIGCYLCPAMLESEYEVLRDLHPDVASRWEAFVSRWARKAGLPEEYLRWGLWRWQDLPPKMQELCQRHGIQPAAAQQSTPVHVQPTQEKRVMISEEITKDFPLLGDLTYLDSAAISISPEPVLQAMIEYEHHYRANVGRGVHRLSQIATQKYWHAHEKIARFIGASTGTVVFTKNSTEAITMVAAGLAWKPGDHIVTTILEHHSNLLPWMRLRRQGVTLTVVPIRADYSLDAAAISSAITESTRLVALTHASNVLGTITPVEQIAEICRAQGVPLLVDGAQTVPHMPVDVGRLGCEYLCFSGHKMCGPTGTGVLWMKDPLPEPLCVGGGAVERVTLGDYTLTEGYARYEAGTQNIAGGIGLGAAADYLTGIGMDNVRAHETRLTTDLVDGLKGIPGVTVYAPADPALRTGVVSFTVEGLDPHQVAHLLDEEADIMVRSGHHCCMPLMQSLGLPDGTVRASVYIYTTHRDIEALVATVDAIARGNC